MVGIESLVVDPGLRRRGIGRSLVDRLVHKVAGQTVYVEEVNPTDRVTRAFFKSLRWQGQIDRMNLERSLGRHPVQLDMPKGYALARYEPEDQEELERLLREAFFTESPRFRGPEPKTVRGLVSSPSISPERILLARGPASRVPVGAAIFQEKACSDGSVGDLHWLAVRADHRSLGLGTALVSACLAEMCRRGYRRATIRTQGSFGHAVRIYRRFGFRTRDYSIMFQSVNEPSGLSRGSRERGGQE